MTTETPVTDGGTTTADATSDTTTPALPQADTTPVAFPFAEVPTGAEQPGLDAFLDQTPTDDPQQDAIGPVTTDDQQALEFGVCREGSRIRINSVYSGTVVDIMATNEYRMSDHGYLGGISSSVRRQDIFIVDLDTPAERDQLHILVEHGYGGQISQAEYQHATTDARVEITQVQVTNNDLPAGVNSGLYQTLAALRGEKVFYKNRRGNYLITTVREARDGHVKIEDHDGHRTNPKWCFIADDPTDPHTGPGYLSGAEQTSQANWGLTPTVSGEPGKIRLLDIGYTPVGREYPRELHDDNNALSEVFEDPHRTATDQTDAMVDALETHAAIDLDAPSVRDAIDAVTGVGGATARQLSGLAQKKRRPSKATLRKRLENAETVDISEGDPEVAERLKEFQAARDDPAPDTTDESDSLLAIGDVLSGGPELHEISGQYTSKAMADIRRALDGADQFDADAALRLFTAFANGGLFSPNGVKTGSLVQMEFGDVDMACTAFAGAYVGEDDPIDLSAPETSLGMRPALFVSRRSLTETVPILETAWEDSPTHRLADLQDPAATIVERFRTRDDNGDSVIPEPVGVTDVEPHLTESKIGLASPSDEEDAERRSWVSVPETFASVLAGLLGINLLKESPEDLSLRVYSTGAIELNHPSMDLWVTLTT